VHVAIANGFCCVALLAPCIPLPCAPSPTTLNAQSMHAQAANTTALNVLRFTMATPQELSP